MPAFFNEVHVFEYKTEGTCSTRIRFSIENGKIRGLAFENGCDGNLKAIGKLIEGRDAREIEGLLAGLDCSGRGTSCGDQLAKALRAALKG
jgi:uncharacterized protein (TIGR03905 family)